MNETPKALPHDADAERTVLGAVLVDNVALDSASQLDPSDFYGTAHRRIYEAIGALRLTGRAIDLVSVKDYLARQGALEEAGGVAYLARLVDGVPRQANVDAWVQIIKDHARRRRLAHLGNRLAQQATDGAEPGELVDANVQALLAEADTGTGWLDNTQLVKAAVREIEAQQEAPDGILGLRTGLIDLDRRLQGIRRGWFGVIGGRPGHGKSALLQQIAENVADREEDGRVVFFSLEMGGVSLMKRRIAAASMVSTNRLHRAEAPEVLEDRWGRINRAAERCADDALMFNTGCRSVAQMRAAAREVQVRHGLALVCVDYVQIINPPRRRERRDLEIEDVSRELLDMAHALDVPVIAATQLNRESESQPDGRPMLRHIAGGDAIVRDIDWCVLIQRHIKPPKGKSPDDYRNLAYLWLAKHRHGAESKVQVGWSNVWARFQSLAEEQEGAA